MAAAAAGALITTCLSTSLLRVMLTVSPLFNLEAPCIACPVVECGRSWLIYNECCANVRVLSVVRSTVNRPAGSDAAMLHATDPEEGGDVVYEHTAGALPGALEVSSSGELSGKVPLQAAETFHFTVQARDVAGDASDRLFTFTLANGMTDTCDGSSVTTTTWAGK